MTSRTTGVLVLTLAVSLASAAARQAVQTSPPGARIPTAQQDAPLPAGAISGVVVDGATGAPVPGALVRLSVQGVVTQPLLGVQPRQIADDRGRFAFLHLPGGVSYTIAASRFGYLDGGYGRDTAPTDPLRAIDLRGDQWVANISVAIWKPGAISGMVRDEAGDPVAGVYVRAIAKVRLHGRDALAAGPMTVTDDRGAYRLAGLAPGRYLIQVPSTQATMPAGTVHRMMPGNDPDAALDIDETTRLVIGRYPLPPPPADGRPMAYPMAFHPSAMMLTQALEVTLSFGVDRGGVDVTLAPAPAARVSGIVEAPEEALAFLTLRLLPAGLEGLGQGAEAATALVGADGRFTFLNVPVGAYTIDAPLRITELTTTMSGTRMYFPNPPGRYGWSRESDPVGTAPGLSYMSTDFRGGAGANYSGRGHVTAAGADVDGVIIRLRTNATMSGRVVAEPDPEQPDVKAPARFLVSLDPADGDVSQGVPRPRSGTSADAAPGAFTMNGIAAGRYWLRLPGSPGWVLKSVVWRGRDYANEPFDATAGGDFTDVVVTVTNAGPVLSGSVRGSDGLDVDRAMVVAFPVSPALWRDIGLWPAQMRSASVSSAGLYRLTGLPAGEYFVAAVDRAVQATWRDPAVLKALQQSAARVTLAWGSQSHQDVAAVVVR